MHILDAIKPAFVIALNSQTADAGTRGTAEHLIACQFGPAVRFLVLM
jgi:hypothetical protein